MPSDTPFDWVRIAVDDYLEEFDVGAVEAVLSTVLANKLQGNAIWLILIAPPSSGKTFILQPLEDIWDCEILSTITPRTFLSGAKTHDGRDPSLLTRLGDRPFVVVKDLGTILETNPRDRAELFSQLREVYDGQITKSFGTGATRSWSGKMTLIVAMTGAIDQYTELAAELGERFLRIRLKTPLDQVKLAKRSMDIAGEEDQIQRELHNSYREALMEARECLNEVSLSDTTLDTLSCLAAVAARARTTVPSKLQPEPEATPRIMKQLTYLAQGQCALRGWRDTEDFSLLRRVAVDVIPEPRRGMLKDAGRKILKYGHVEISDLDYMSGSTQRRVMRDLDRLNVVDAEKGEADGRGRPPTRYSFEDEFRGWIDEASLYFSSRS